MARTGRGFKFSQHDSPASAGGHTSNNLQAATGTNEVSNERGGITIWSRGLERRLPHSLQLLNIRGLLGEGGRTKAGFISDLANRDKSLVTMLTETHLKETVRSSEILFHIPGYDIFRSDRVNRECGGVAIIMHNSLSGELIGTFDNSVVEFVVVKAYSLNTVFCCVYRPPDTSLREFSQALTELKKIFAELPSPTPTLVLGGTLIFQKKSSSGKMLKTF